MQTDQDRGTREPGQFDDRAAEQGRLLRFAGTVGGITLISRIFGYLRDVVVAAFLGTGLAADAFVAAFRLPNTFRRVVGEGNVSAAFVPVYSEEARNRTDEEVWAYVGRFFTAVAVAALAIVAVGIVLAPWLVPLIAPGFDRVPGKLELTIRLARLTFPYLFFIALAAVLGAVLNALDRFAAAAFTPVVFNVTIIGVTLATAGRWLSPVYAVALGAVTGGLLQWLFLTPFARRAGMSFRPRWDPSDRALRRTGRLMVPGLFGVGITQINVLVGQALASTLAGGSVASLYYAGRLNEFPLGVFAISIATVVLPSMSRHAAADDEERLLDSLGFALRQAAFIVLPASVGLIVLRHDIVSVLYERGLFDAGSTDLTAGALLGYAVGLLGYASVRILAPCFYALKDTRTPVVVAAIAMVGNIAGCLALMGPLDHVGIALANSLAGYLNTALLVVLLHRRLGRLGGRRLLTSLLRLVAASALMGWVVASAAVRWPPGAASGLLAELLGVTGLIALGALTYTAAAAVLGADEIGELVAVVSSREAGTLDGGDADPGD